MIRGAMSKNGVVVLSFLLRGTTANEPKIHAYALKEAKTSHARLPMSNIYAGLSPLSPFQSYKELSG